MKRLLTALSMLLCPAALAAETTTSYDLPNCGGRAFVTRGDDDTWLEVVGSESCSNLRINDTEMKMKRRGDTWRMETELFPRPDKGTFIHVESNSGHTIDTIYLAPLPQPRVEPAHWEEDDDCCDQPHPRHIRIRIRESYHPRPRVIIRPLPPPPHHQVRIRFSSP